MVEFTNAVFGEPVEFKVAEHNTLALSRGSKGFFAMGDLSREFETGLPDGEYCDIISECQKKIQVSGGKAFIGKWNETCWFDKKLLATCNWVLSSWNFKRNNTCQ